MQWPRRQSQLPAARAAAIFTYCVHETEQCSDLIMQSAFQGTCTLDNMAACNAGLPSPLVATVAPNVPGGLRAAGEARLWLPADQMYALRMSAGATVLVSACNSHLSSNWCRTMHGNRMIVTARLQPNNLHIPEFFCCKRLLFCNLHDFLFSNTHARRPAGGRGRGRGCHKRAGGAG